MGLKLFQRLGSNGQRKAHPSKETPTTSSLACGISSFACVENRDGICVLTTTNTVQLVQWHVASSGFSATASQVTERQPSARQHRRLQAVEKARFLPADRERRVARLPNRTTDSPEKWLPQVAIGLPTRFPADPEPVRLPALSVLPKCAFTFGDASGAEPLPIRRRVIWLVDRAAPMRRDDTHLGLPPGCQKAVGETKSRRSILFSSRSGSGGHREHI